MKMPSLDWKSDSAGDCGRLAAIEAIITGAKIETLGHLEEMKMSSGTEVRWTR
jgi:hypothetical protein